MINLDVQNCGTLRRFSTCHKRALKKNTTAMVLSGKSWTASCCFLLLSCYAYCCGLIYRSTCAPRGKAKLASAVRYFGTNFGGLFCREHAEVT